MEFGLDKEEQFDEMEKVQGFAKTTTDAAGMPEELHLGFRLFLCKERSFYGPGTHRLLILTDETRSLREACRRMEVSYSKGRKIIALTEQQLGYAILESKQGGRTGGYSIVTPAGRELIRKYTMMREDAEQVLAGVFQKHFGDEGGAGRA